MGSLQRLAAARADGLKEGRADGLKEGREAGLKEGREAGLKEGREAGFKAGQASVERGVAQLSATPTSADVQQQVKSIMNQTYQLLAARFRSKESFPSAEILTTLLATIKVSFNWWLPQC